MTLERIRARAALPLVQADGAVLLDLRPPAAFAQGHAAGALSVPFSTRGLGVRAGIALPPGTAAVLIAQDDDIAEAAAAQLTEARIPVHGIIEGGTEAWGAEGLPVVALRELTVHGLAPLAESATVIDVREPLEWSTGHVPGALLVPLGRLREAIPSLPRDRTVIAICEAGVRSCTAASILAAAGMQDVAHVPEGSAGYRRAGLPLAHPSDEVPAR